MELRFSQQKFSLITLLLISILTLMFPPLAGASEEESEPKRLQQLYKCFDREISKLSKQNKRGKTTNVYNKCKKQMDRWLAMLPEESHEVFLAQLTGSVELALEDAANGRFVADEE